MQVCVEASLGILHLLPLPLAVGLLLSDSYISGVPSQSLDLSEKEFVSLNPTLSFIHAIADRHRNCDV